MDRNEVNQTVKELICKVTGLEIEEIGDSDSFRDDMELDSLALIEIGVEVDYAYKLRLSEDEMATLRKVDEAVDLVLKKMAEKESSAT